MAPGNATEGVQCGPLTTGSGDLDPGDTGLLMGFTSLGICCEAATSQASVDADVATQVGAFPDLERSVKALTLQLGFPSGPRLKGGLCCCLSGLNMHRPGTEWGFAGEVLAPCFQASASLCSHTSPSPVPADHILESRDRKGGIPWAHRILSVLPPSSPETPGKDCVSDEGINVLHCELIIISVESHLN